VCLPGKVLHLSQRNFHLIRKLVAVAILASSITFLAFNLSRESSSNRDFIAYWAAAQLLGHHKNPYGRQETMQLEQSAGWLQPEPMMMLTPPFCLPLIASLGMIGSRSGAFVWTLLIIGCLVLAVRTLRDLNGKPPDRIHLHAYFFAPTLFCIFAGQAVVFVMIGLVLFLKFHSSKPLLAGLCLALSVTIKPHLFVAFGAALLYWAFTSRHYRVLSGILTGIAALGLAATLLDPHCWSQYLTAMREQHVEEKVLPNLSLLFRATINPNAAWLQLVPCTGAAVWALWYARRHRADWDWMVQGSLLMLISVMVAPYSWFFDEITLLPAVLHGLYVADRNGRSLGWYAACAGVALMMVFAAVPINLFYYTWTPLAWLATYAYAVRSNGTAVVHPADPSPAF
jgi:hypothetical protein